MLSLGPRGLRVSRCDPGTQNVAPESGPTSTIYLFHVKSMLFANEQVFNYHGCNERSGAANNIHAWFVGWNKTIPHHAETHAYVRERLADGTTLCECTAVAQIMRPIIRLSQHSR
jgi:hypothetical protein